MLNGKGFWLFKSIIIFILLVFPPTALSQETEQEPNNPCSSAQIIGEITLPSYVDGSLDYLDVDFFRFSAVPDVYLVVNLDGIDGEMIALTDPYLGLFDTNCNLLAVNDDNNGLDSELKFTVPADGEFILATTSCCDFSFSGSFSTGSYRLSVAEAPPPSSISGRVVDAESGMALPGDTEPYTQVILYQCYTLDCSYPMDVAYKYTDSEGRFLFDSSWGSDLTAGTYQVEARANGYITTRTDPLTLSESEQLEIGDIALQEQTFADSVTGRLVDAVSGLPLPGDTWPYAWAALHFCYDGSTCSWTSWINSGPTDSDGLFMFTSDYMSYPLITGWYRVYATAWDYDSADSGIFELTENEQKDLGDITLMPPPIIFSEVRPCGDLPPEGGKCSYSVRVTSNLPDELELGAWSLVEASGTGSELGWSRFQAGQPRSLELETGESKVVRFSFKVPETVQNGTYICPDIWAGLGEEIPYFDSLAHENPLFCITKGLTGTYSVLSKQAAKAVVRGQQGMLIHGQPRR